MKNYLKLLILFVAGIILLQTACVPDETDDPVTDDRDYFIGNWMAEETSTLFPDPITFTVKITADPNDESQVLLSNFYHLGSAAADRVKAQVGSSTITIPQQTVCDVVINGTGILSGKKINLNYFVNDGAEVDQVTAVYSKIN